MGATLAGETMSDRYDRVEHERALRKEWAERAGLGFELPPKPSKSRVVGLNGPKRTEIPSRRLVVTACA